MKLELKHIAPYLPYGLDVIYDWESKGINSPGSVANITENGFKRELLYALEQGAVKIFGLLPLSCLTEEIEHNGERFVPIERISEVMTREWADVCDDWIIALLDDIANADNIIQKCPHDMWEYFVSYHIDVFGLIPAGLAVDKREVK